jgi:Protein of unknown function (DUF2569)
MFCPNCACELPAVAKFCVRCGSRVEHLTSRVETISVATPQPTNPAQETTDFEKYADNYSRMSGEELLHLSADMSSLRQAAQDALTAEISKRDLRVQRPEPAPQVKNPYQGVGGWLGFFIFGLLVLSPILTVVNIVGGFNQFGNDAANSAAVLGAMLFGTLLSLAVMSFGLYAAVRLLRLKPNAVGAAKRYLVLLLLYSGLMIALSIYGNIDNPQAEQSFKELTPLFRNAGYVFTWYFYFEKSKRVAATYPK